MDDEAADGQQEDGVVQQTCELVPATAHEAGKPEREAGDEQGHSGHDREPEVALLAGVEAVDVDTAVALADIVAEVTGPRAIPGVEDHVPQPHDEHQHEPDRKGHADDGVPVSYTHLTLPT